MENKKKKDSGKHLKENKKETAKKIQAKAEFSKRTKAKVEQPKKLEVKPAKKEVKIIKDEKFKKTKVINEKRGKAFLTILAIGLIIIIIMTTIYTLKRTPTQAISNFFDALKGNNEEQINKYSNYSELISYLYSDGVDTDTEKQINENCFSKLEYKVNSVNIEGNTATVNVEVTNKNFRNILTKWTQTVYKKFIAGETMNNDEQKELLNTYLTDDSLGTLTVTEDITLVKENGEWKIQNNINLEDAIFPGLREVVATMDSLVQENK